MASTIAAPVSGTPVPDEGEVSLLRLYVLRATYALLVVGTGALVVPDILDHELLSRGAIPSRTPASDGSTVDEAELKDLCAKKLSSFKRPKTIEISTDPLPLSGVGKVMKTMLRDLALTRRQTAQTSSET